MGRVWFVVRALLCTEVVCGVASMGASHGAHAAPHYERMAASPAAAGSSAGWSAPQCGREPVAPTVETGTVDRYNASIDRVTAYERAARAYNGCVSKAAIADQTAISNDARARIDAIQAVSGAVQKRIAGNFTALTNALRAGSPKLQSAH